MYNIAACNCNKLLAVPSADVACVHPTLVELVFCSLFVIYIAVGSFVRTFDDMIISKGENIYPARIEEILNSHPKVLECIVTGVPYSTRGECVAAYVIKADESLTVAELINFCDSSPNISKYQAPDSECKRLFQADCPW